MSWRRGRGLLLGGVLLVGVTHWLDRPSREAPAKQPEPSLSQSHDEEIAARYKREDEELAKRLPPICKQYKKDQEAVEAAGGMAPTAENAERRYLWLTTCGF